MTDAQADPEPGPEATSDESHAPPPRRSAARSRWWLGAALAITVGGIGLWAARATVEGARVDGTRALEAVASLGSRLAEVEETLTRLQDAQSVLRTTTAQWRDGLEEGLLAVRAAAEDSRRIADAAATPADVRAGADALNERLEAAIADLAGLQTKLADAAVAAGDSAPAEEGNAQAAPRAAAPVPDIADPTPASAARLAEAAATAALDFVQQRLVVRIEAAEARVAQLERAAAAEAEAPNSGALVVGIGQLRDRLRTSAPFMDELAAVQALARPAPPSDVAAALETLETLAAGGAPTTHDLTRRFAAVADAVAAPPSDTEGWGADLWARLRGAVLVRRTGDVAGGDPGARVARAELRLEEGDLAAAIEEVAELDGIAAIAAAEWLGDARARLSVDRASSILAATAAAAVVSEAR